MTVKSAYSVETPTNLFDNGYTTDQANYLVSSPFARWVFVTSGTNMFLKTWNTIYGTFPAWAHIAVFVNGSLQTTLEATATGSQIFNISLPAGSKTVALVAGLQTKPPASSLLGTFMKSTYFSGGVTTQRTPINPGNRVLVYGDSIVVGGNAAYPASEAWPVLLRSTVPVAVEAWGYRTLYDDAVDAAAIDTLVTQIASFSPGVVWLAIGTNDYGLNKWSAAAFGAAYEDLLDDLIVALPSATIYCQAPLFRTTETANGNGSTLQDYRDVIAAAVTAVANVDVTYVDASAWLTTGDLADGVHPTTAGHAIVAAEVAAIV